MINISDNHPVIYGITSVTVAIGIGIIVAYSFKKLLK